MFVGLWKKECGQIGKSLIYWLYVIILCVFFVSQLGSMKEYMVKEPKKGSESYSAYGEKSSTDKKDIMRAALGNLAWGVWYDHFETYPVGFAKSVMLSEEEKTELAEILEETTGLSGDAVGDDIASYFEKYDPETNFVAYVTEPKEGLTYEDFLKQMKRVEKILGPGSEFSEEMMKASVRLPMDYEGAKEAYAHLVEQDGYTGGYLRLFCDYMGIMLGILPIFDVATRVLRDKRAQMQELLFVRQVSSTVLVGSRLAAMVTMMMIPVILLSLAPMIDCITFTNGSGMKLDYLAFLKYDLGWLLPTVLIVTAVGYFVTEFTESALAVLIQGIWWFVSLQLGVRGMSGGMYGFNLIPRHNTEFNNTGFAEGFQQLLLNRMIYVGMALVLMAATVWIYDKKRKGHLRKNGKKLRTRKRTDQA